MCKVLFFRLIEAFHTASTMVTMVIMVTILHSCTCSSVCIVLVLFSRFFLSFDSVPLICFLLCAEEETRHMHWSPSALVQIRKCRTCAVVAQHCILQNCLYTDCAVPCVLGIRLHTIIHHMLAIFLLHACPSSLLSAFYCGRICGHEPKFRPAYSRR